MSSYTEGLHSRADAMLPGGVWDNPYDIRTAMQKPPTGRDWLITERIERGRGILVAGIGGSSKTRLLYHIAIAGAVGYLPWGWTVPKRFKSVLVLTEDTATDVHQIVYHMVDAMGLSESQREAVAESITLFPLAGKRVKFLAFNGRTLTETEQLEALEAKVEELGDVGFIGIDPAISVTEGDESEQHHQRALANAIDGLGVRTGAAVALVSHASKASINADELGSHNSRGGGALTDGVRGEFAMRTMTAAEASKAGITDVEERKRHVQLCATKGNHLPPAAFVPVWLRRGEHGVLAASDVAMTESASKKPPKAEREADMLVDLLSEKLASVRTNLADDGRVPDAARIPVGDLREAYKAEQGAAFNRRRWSEALAALKERDDVVLADDHLSLKVSGMSGTSESDTSDASEGVRPSGPPFIGGRTRTPDGGTADESDADVEVF
ncbi:AAA family ATPase [Methylolobus aquaticus]|nr:AAA family ATPase [Methylolobus aquaticus]